MDDLQYLNQALKIEKKMIESTRRCRNYYEKRGNAEWTESMDAIMKNEEKHIGMIQDMIRKMQKPRNPSTSGITGRSMQKG